MPDVIYISWPVTPRLLPSALVGGPLFAAALLDMRADGQIHPASSIKKAPSMPSPYTQLLPGACAYPGTSSPCVSARVGSPLAQPLSQIPTPMLDLESARRARSEPRCRRRACHFPRRARLWLSFARCCGPSCLREQAGEQRTTRLLSAQQPVARAASRRTCLQGESGCCHAPRVHA